MLENLSEHINDLRELILHDNSLTPQERSFFLNGWELSYELHLMYKHSSDLEKKNISVGLGELEQSDIELRSKIYSTFLSKTSMFLKSLFQGGDFNNNSMFIYKDFEVMTLSNNDFNAPIGSWRNQKFSMVEDIILLYVYTKNKSYKESLREIYNYIEKNQDNIFSIGNTNNTKPLWCIQEKYPINIDNICIMDCFQKSLKYEEYDSELFIYNNIHNNHIGYVLQYFNKYNHPIKVYYTLWRHHSSPIMYFAPIYPEPPYMIFNIENVKNARNGVIFLDSEKDVEDFGRSRYDGYVRLACPFGPDHLDQADFSDLPESLPVYIKMPDYRLKNGKFLESYLIKLKDNLKNRRGHIQYGYIFDTNIYEDIDSILRSDEYVIRDSIFLPSNTSSGIVKAGEKIPGSDRNRKTILDPIIQSGTINWIYSKEKVGKTWLALTIAYAVGKGDIKVGQWEAKEAFKVLYIDGEMPGDFIQKRCDMIMKGYEVKSIHDDNVYKSIPFAVYSFYENEHVYDSILDDEWLKQYRQQLDSYDLLIFDNYHCLNNNNIDIKPFIKFLKDITKKGTAIIVLDHTNSKGDLQGSISKKRFADYGILLERTQDGYINITNEFDRDGYAQKSPNHTIEYVFSEDDSFSIRTVYNKENETQNELTDNDKKLLYIYVVCRKQYNGKKWKKQKDIATLLHYEDNSISQYVNDVDRQLDCQANKGREIRHHISNIKFFREELDRLNKLPLEELDKEFNSNIHILKNPDYKP